MLLYELDDAITYGRRCAHVPERTVSLVVLGLIDQFTHCGASPLLIFARDRPGRQRSALVQTVGDRDGPLVQLQEGPKPGPEVFARRTCPKHFLRSPKPVLCRDLRTRKGAPRQFGETEPGVAGGMHGDSNRVSHPRDVEALDEGAKWHPSRWENACSTVAPHRAPVNAPCGWQMMSQAATPPPSGRPSRRPPRSGRPCRMPAPAGRRACRPVSPGSRARSPSRARSGPPGR